MSTTIFKPLISGRQAIAKIFIFAIVIASVAGCSARRGTSATTDEGVVINGVRWATRNADGYRTFVSSPEMPGGFYAWNRNRARDRYTLRRSMLQRGGSQGNSFDPCPPGWRLPTEAQFRSLIRAGSVWVEKNGVYGRLFGTAPNQLFLPAAGEFVREHSEANYVNEKGYYFTTPIDGVVNRSAMILRFCQDSIDIHIVYTALSRSVIPPSHASLTATLTSQQRMEAAVFFPTAPELSVRCVAITD